jgi:ABC-type iron transport system FetAB permease component
MESANLYQVHYERQLRRVKEEQEEINELLTLGLIRKMLERQERERNPKAIQQQPPYNAYAESAVHYERQLRRVKEEQEEINELLTLGLIRKMLERQERERNNI